MSCADLRFCVLGSPGESRGFGVLIVSPVGVMMPCEETCSPWSWVQVHPWLAP